MRERFEGVLTALAVVFRVERDAYERIVSAVDDQISQVLQRIQRLPSFAYEDAHFVAF